MWQVTYMTCSPTVRSRASWCQPDESCCRGALFGMAIEVFFESTTPLLHVLGCLKIAGRSKGRLYFLAGKSLSLVM